MYLIVVTGLFLLCVCILVLVSDNKKLNNKLSSDLDDCNNKIDSLESRLNRIEIKHNEDVRKIHKELNENLLTIEAIDDDLRYLNPYTQLMRAKEEIQSSKENVKIYQSQVAMYRKIIN